MRVTIAGKGGAGKTTIAGTLARCLGRRAGDVIAMDADSNPNLAITLGLSRQVSEGIDGRFDYSFWQASGQTAHPA